MLFRYQFSAFSVNLTWRRLHGSDLTEPDIAARSGATDLNAVLIQSSAMFDLLASIGSAAIGDIIKRAIAAGIDWGKRRKKPPSEEVRKKVEELVAAAAKKTPLPESTAEQQRIIGGITELTLPTFEQVVDYSPNTRGIVTCCPQRG